MAPAPRGNGPFADDRTVGEWTVVVRSIVGQVRERLEDAWRILDEARLGGRRVHVFSIFDGLGGMPRGQQGAWAAADGLEKALAGATGPDDVLARLNRPVLKSGGNTTADIALFFADESPGDGLLLAIGDSSAYDLWEGEPRRVAAHDATGPHTLTDFLGLSQIGGRTVALRVPPGQNLLLCTDGVDGVVDAEPIRRLLTADAASLGLAADAVLRAVDDAGSPDNATVVAAHRRA